MPMPRLLIALVAALVFASSAPALAEELLVIANRSVDVNGPLSLDQIAAIYLLRTTTWPDGSHIIPVNREVSSSLRAEFTARVLREDDGALIVYWNQMHFMGKFPPVVQESDQAMLAFVQKVPGSVGYIAASVVPIDVKVLARVP